MVAVGEQLHVEYVCVKKSTEKRTCKVKAEPTVAVLHHCVWV